MLITRIRSHFRASVRHSLVAFRFFVLERPGLYRLAQHTSARFPALKRWAVRRILEAQTIAVMPVAPIVQAAPVVPQAPATPGGTPTVPHITAAEVDHLRYLFQRAMNARRRD
ncbi:hypothetical protein [Paraburkholderia sp. BR10954]|uniref:hypothetical protein n=1 Tax=Paraburkholderia sp. BR10954 TaxID=3236995 RepID=UPI0034D15384